MTSALLRSALQTDLDTVSPIRTATVYLGKDFIARQEIASGVSLYARVVLVPTSFTIGPIPKTASHAPTGSFKRAVYQRKQTFEIHCWARTETADLAPDALKEANVTAIETLIDRVAVGIRRFGTDESVTPGNGSISDAIKTNEYGASAMFTMVVNIPVFDKVYETVSVTPGVSGSYT